jgi:hypothetical protein
LFDDSAKIGLDGYYDPKRSGSRGFHEGIFDYGFGGFSTVKKRGKRNSAFAKRIPEMTSRGINGDAFTGSLDRKQRQTELGKQIDSQTKPKYFSLLFSVFCL